MRRVEFNTVATFAVIVVVNFAVSKAGDSLHCPSRPVLLTSPASFMPASNRRAVEPMLVVLVQGKAAALAPGRNAVLRDELVWTFGGKQQRGWYLYDELIYRLLSIANQGRPGVASERFLRAVASWQAKMGLNPTGSLDETTLQAMIKEWQGKRLKDRTVAQSDQLLTAPSSDFYDPARPIELRQVEVRAYAAYKRLIRAALADRSLVLKSQGKGELAPAEKFLKIISAFRSREYQEKLRRESPEAGTAGLAVNSPHFTGRALDLYVGGQPVDTRDANRAIQVQGSVYKWLVRNAERFGFQPYFYEPWHWEYVGDAKR